MPLTPLTPTTETLTAATPDSQTLTAARTSTDITLFGSTTLFGDDTLFGGLYTAGVSSDTQTLTPL